jgi:hypothetical protein
LQTLQLISHEEGDLERELMGLNARLHELRNSSHSGIPLAESPPALDPLAAFVGQVVGRETPWRHVDLITYDASSPPISDRSVLSDAI